MTWLHTMTQSSAVSQLGWTLVHFVWEGLAIALMLQVVLAALRQRTPQARYASGCVAMGLLAVAPILTYCHLAAPRSESENPGQPSQVAAQSTPSEAPAPASRSVSLQSKHTASDAPTSPNDRSAKDGGAVVSKWLEQATATLTRIAPWLVAAWAIGVLVLSIRNLAAWVAMRQMRSVGTTRLAGESIDRMAASLSARLGLRRAIRILQSARVDSPLVIGFFKPIILLPASVLTELPAAQVEALLAHELAHVLRNDYLVNLLQCAIETVLFYHPAVWWVSRQVRIEREHCCDDIAVGVTQKRDTYVRALAAIADVRATSLFPAASGSVLMPRLRRILGLPNTDASRSSFWLAGVIGVAVCLLLFVSVGPNLTAHASVADKNVPQPTEPIRAGDLLDVAVADLGGPNVLERKRARVSKDGTVGLYYIAPLNVAGMTFGQAERAVEKAYSDAHMIDRAKTTIRRIESADHLNISLGPILPGDEIDITIYDLIGPALASEHVLRIERDGKIVLPYLAPIQAAGFDEQALERQIALAYRDAHLIQTAAVGVFKVRDADQASVPLGPIEPGDLLRISTEPEFKGWSPPKEATFDVRVDAEGKIGMPQMGAVKVAGLTAAQATIALGKALSAPDPRIQHLVWLLKLESGNRRGFRPGPIQPGDRIQVTLIQPPANGPAISTNVRQVAQDGTIPFPFLGSVRIVGMSETAAQETIEKAYAAKHPGSERAGVGILRLPPQPPPSTTQP